MPLLQTCKQHDSNCLMIRLSAANMVPHRISLCVSNKLDGCFPVKMGENISDIEKKLVIKPEMAALLFK